MSGGREARELPVPNTHFTLAVGDDTLPCDTHTTGGETEAGQTFGTSLCTPPNPQELLVQRRIPRDTRSECCSQAGRHSGGTARGMRDRGTSQQSHLPPSKFAFMEVPQLSNGDLGGAAAAGWGTWSHPKLSPQERDHRAGSASKGPPRGMSPPPPGGSEHPGGLRTTPPCPPGPTRRQSGTISLPFGGFHRTSSPPRVGKGLVGNVLPGVGIWEQLPAPAAPAGRKRRAGAGEEEGGA